MDLMKAPRLLKLTLTRLDQDLGALSHLQCLNVAKTCHAMQSHPLSVVQCQVESQFLLIADTFKTLIGTTMLMSVGSPQHIAPHVSTTTTTLCVLIIMLQLHQQRVFVGTLSLDLTPISLTTCPTLSPLRQN